MPKWTKGAKVEGLDEDGVWYPATIGTVHRDGTYRVDWQGKWADTYSARMPEAKIRPRQSGRDAGRNELKGRDVAGIYVLNVPKAETTYYKIGISESDLERRVSNYIVGSQA